MADPDAARLEKHLSTCPHCSEYLAQIRATIAAAGHVQTDDLTPEVLDELVRALPALAFRLKGPCSGEHVPTTDINETTIWYESVGAGPPCLVLHGGLGVDHTLYRATLTPLEHRLHLIYLDHRGNGRSGRPPLDTITIEQLADDAAALTRHLGHERVVVMGHSFGGFVAQELALRHPQAVSALVLVDTTPGQLGVTENPDDDQGPPRHRSWRRRWPCCRRRTKSSPPACAS